jgi:hypothetical protein
MAWIQQLERGSRGKDITSLVKYQLPGIIQAMSFGEVEGATPKTMAAMGLALGAAGEDPHSRRARTAQVNLMKQLKVGLAERGKQFGTADEMLNYVLSDQPGAQDFVAQLLGPLYTGELARPAGEMGPEMQAAVRRLAGFDIDLTAEAPMFMPMVQMLQRRGRSGKPTAAYNYFTQLMRDLTDPRDPRSISMFRSQQQVLAQSEFQTSERAQRTMRGTADVLRINDTIAGLTGSVREELPGLLQASGVTATGQKIAMALFNARAMTSRTIDDVRAAQVAAIEAGKFSEEQIGVGQKLRQGEVWSAFWGGPASLNDQQRIVNEKLDELIEAVKQERSIRIDAGGEHIRGQMQQQAQGAGR